MNIAILGAYGLVGSNICKVLERDYPEIEIIKYKCDEFNPLDPFDRTQENPLVDYIIYAAGYGQPQMFGKDKLRTIEINTTSLSRAFDFLKPGGKFLFISTAEVYSGAPSPHKETDIGTTTPQHPRACYIEGKRCGEAICMAYSEQGYDVKIARLALAYGPGTKKGDTRVINQFIEQALTTGEIIMKDKGDAVRTYCYVEDAVDMLLCILFKGDRVVYNVGGESKTTIQNLALEIGKILECDVSWSDDGLKGAPDDVCLDMSWWHNKFTSLEEGLRLTIEYQKQLYV
jgi:UDP-glucuronate decarboxylase